MARGATYIDDNFGVYQHMDDEEDVAFYRDVQRRSVAKKCKGCGRTVKILPEYAYCNECATRLENGQDLM